MHVTASDKRFVKVRTGIAQKVQILAVHSSKPASTFDRSQERSRLRYRQSIGVSEMGQSRAPGRILAECISMTDGRQTLLVLNSWRVRYSWAVTSWRTIISNESATPHYLEPRARRLPLIRTSDQCIAKPCRLPYVMRITIFIYSHNHFKMLQNIDETIKDKKLLSTKKM